MSRRSETDTKSSLLPRSFRFLVENEGRKKKALFIPDGRSFFARPDGEPNAVLRAAMKALRPMARRINKNTDPAAVTALLDDFQRMVKHQVKYLVKSTTNSVGMEAETLAAAVAYALSTNGRTSSSPNSSTDEQRAAATSGPAAAGKDDEKDDGGTKEDFDAKTAEETPSRTTATSPPTAEGGDVHADRSFARAGGVQDVTASGLASVAAIFDKHHHHHHHHHPRHLLPGPLRQRRGRARGVAAQLACRATR